ncbi:hypothetical protein RRG08_058123 [Elysia crispata]|uniref:Uncharacterized protein n=1 Tax=Elysia crispata TaxID=231223 RepID=A0AAE1DXL8_9GAST|nr:hypothetical protein RRG08_058123 [Elysia crispata]
MHETRNVTLISSVNNASDLPPCQTERLSDVLLSTLFSSLTFISPCDLLRKTMKREELRQIEALKEAVIIQVDTIFSVGLVFGLPGSVLALVTLSSMASVLLRGT